MKGMALLAMAVVLFYVAEAMREERRKWRMRELAVWAGILGIAVDMVKCWWRNR
jgi:multisubunit Na+/H+ antiporter MnhB subunit